MPSITKSPGTIVSDASFGSVPWSNPGNASASDDSRATSALTGVDANSEYLKATNFGFDTDVPVGATITEYTVSVERSANAVDRLKDGRLRAVIGGVIGSNDYANVVNWPDSDAVQTYNLLSDGPTAAQVRASDFGCALAALWISGASAQARVDHVQITISWTTDSLPPGCQAGVA